MSLGLQIETTAACNGRCHFCPYSKAVNDSRRGKMMDTGLFYKIADEVATIPLIKVVALNGLGEPLLDPRIYDFVARIKGMRPDIITMFHTNGVYLSDPQRLHDAGLDNLVVSLNANSAEQHERVMGIKGQYENICANIKKARAIPGWLVSVRACFSRDNFTVEDTWVAASRWGSKDGETILVNETNWIDQNRTIQPTDFGNQGCTRALSQIYIDYNGDVGMCCMDAFIKKNFGNVRTQTIREIYSSDEYVKFRLAHAENRALDVPECTGCTRC